MNVFILLIGIILIITTSIIISFIKKNQLNYSLNEETDFNLHSDDSDFIDDKIEFKKVLHSVEEYGENNIDLNYGNNSIDATKEIIRDKDIIKASKKTENYGNIDKEAQKDEIENIIELSQSGLKAVEIAQMLGKGIREVEVIIKLHNINRN